VLTVVSLSVSCVVRLLHVRIGEEDKEGQSEGGSRRVNICEKVRKRRSSKARSVAKIVDVIDASRKMLWHRS
jgi:hypothetical protein